MRAYMKELTGNDNRYGTSRHEDMVTLVEESAGFFGILARIDRKMQAKDLLWGRCRRLQRGA